ncbi:MAG: ferric reductase-like transmembrane domain-containing protein [Gaiellaceae bacterium]|jgi:DMSO/TMAO reductase YedYZ heme-binding membrane subunit
MRHDPTFWILARASGLTAYVLLTLSVLAGIVVKSRPFGSRVRQAAVIDTHRTLAALGLGTLVIHTGSLALDKTVRMPVQALFVPGLSPYRPYWVAFGVLTAELMVVVYASFALRRRIGFKNWRRLHWTTYALFTGGTVHGLLSGSDSHRTWALAIYLGAVAAVAGATTWRFLEPLTNEGGKGVPSRDRPRSM